MKKKKPVLIPQPPQKTGRPEVIVTEEQWKFINQFLLSGCDGASVARHFGMHPDTFYSKVLDRYGEDYGITTFSAYAQLKRAEGHEMIRNKQFERAILSGSDTMLIWLGKQLLGQRDHIEQTIRVPQVKVQTFNEDEALEISTALTALEQHEGNERISEESESDSTE